MIRCFTTIKPYKQNLDISSERPSLAEVLILFVYRVDSEMF